MNFKAWREKRETGIPSLSRSSWGFNNLFPVLLLGKQCNAGDHGFFLFFPSAGLENSVFKLLLLALSACWRWLNVVNYVPNSRFGHAETSTPRWQFFCKTPKPWDSSPRALPWNLLPEESTWWNFGGEFGAPSVPTQYFDGCKFKYFGVDFGLFLAGSWWCSWGQHKFQFLRFGGFRGHLEGHNLENLWDAALGFLGFHPLIHQILLQHPAPFLPTPKCFVLQNLGLNPKINPPPGITCNNQTLFPGTPKAGCSLLGI